VLCCALATLAGLFTATVVAGPITPGNLVVYRVGTGQAALTTGATAVFLDEYTTSGTFVQTITVPASGSSAMTAAGTATTEGIISPSQDGTKLVFSGYRADAGLAAVAGTSSTANPRVIGAVDLTGSVDTSNAVTDTGAVTIRSATTVDGTTYYISTSSNVRYVGTPGGAATSTSVDARNSRQVNLGNNVLYASNGSTAITPKVQSYGVLPTGTTVPTTVVNLATTDAVNGFALFDLDAGVAGPDTLYALSTVQSQLQKYTFDGTSWTASGFIGSVAAANLTGVSSGGSVTLYLTTTTAIQTLTDSSGYNANITGSISALPTPVIAATNTGFRGIGILVVPEPATATMLLAAIMCLGARGRRGA